MRFWPFRQKTRPAELGQLVGALLANQVGQLPELFVEMYEGRRAAAPGSLPSISSEARSCMWAEVGAFYMFLAGTTLIPDIKSVDVARSVFYELLRVPRLPLNDGKYVILPALSAQALAVFHELVVERVSEYNQLTAQESGFPVNPLNPMTRRFATRLFGALEVVDRIDIVGELHVNSLRFVRVISQAADESA